MNFTLLKKLLDDARLPWRLIGLESTPSTQTHAKNELAASAEDFLVVAKTQTGGRGRLGRTWESANEMGIWASLAYRHTSEPAVHLRSMCIAIAMELAGKGIKDVSVKWPNDVLIGDRKAAGILAEVCASPMSADGLVLGFGLNVNQDMADFPKELAKTAVSMRIAWGKEWDKEPVLKGILERYEKVRKDTKVLDVLFNSFCSSVNRYCDLDGTRIFMRGIMADGGLCAVLADGREKIFYSGTLRHEPVR